MRHLVRCSQELHRWQTLLVVACELWNIKINKYNCHLGFVKEATVPYSTVILYPKTGPIRAILCTLKKRSLHAYTRPWACCGSDICIFCALHFFKLPEDLVFEGLIFEWTGSELWLSESERFSWYRWYPWSFEIIQLHVTARPRACCRSGICIFLCTCLFVGPRTY